MTEIGSRTMVTEVQDNDFELRDSKWSTSNLLKRTIRYPVVRFYIQYSSLPYKRSTVL